MVNFEYDTLKQDAGMYAWVRHVQLYYSSCCVQTISVYELQLDRYI
jgi:hypothetical protein